MITIEDCAAFCEADPGWVSELACREGLTMVEAYARAHEATLCANDRRMGTPEPAIPTHHRLVA